METDIMQYTSPSMGCNGYLVQGPLGYVAVDAPEGFAAWVKRTLPADAVVTDLLVTHQHFDHVGDAAALQAATGCKVHGAAAFSRELTLELLGGWMEPVEPYTVDDVLDSSAAGKAVWGGLEWDIYPIPGHAADGMAYGLASAGLVFTGDVLFADSVGRTDFPGGSMSKLVRGIQTHLMALPPGTEVLPGHGPSTTIGEESLNNPYL